MFIDQVGVRRAHGIGLSAIKSLRMIVASRDCKSTKSCPYVQTSGIGTWSISERTIMQSLTGSKGLVPEGEFMETIDSSSRAQSAPGTSSMIYLSKS